MFNVDRFNVAYGNTFGVRCSRNTGSFPLISNGSVPGHEKLFFVRRCSMYTGVQFGSFHCATEVLV